MSDDIVKRLRRFVYKRYLLNPDGPEAADEIERLRALVSAQAQDIVTLGQLAGKAEDQRARIAALEDENFRLAAIACETPTVTECGNKGCAALDDAQARIAALEITAEANLRQGLAENEVAQARIAVLETFIANPPKHRFWGAGEPDCPPELKAGNGELHTLRCKVCGSEDVRDNICRAVLDGDKR